MQEAEAAVAAGANALGFVFAGGPRRVSVEAAGAIAGRVGPVVRRIGVFVDASVQTIQATVDEAGLDGVQLHGSEGAGTILHLKHSHPGLVVFKAIRIQGEHSLRAVEQFAADADAVILDPKDVNYPDRRATPLPIDWLQELPLAKIIVAGGLDAGNVGEVVRRLGPWGVDASGGLEVRPGVKDPAKITAFVREVRLAERRADPPDASGQDVALRSVE